MDSTTQTLRQTKSPKLEKLPAEIRQRIVFLVLENPVACLQTRYKLDAVMAVHLSLVSKELLSDVSYFLQKRKKEWIMEPRTEIAFAHQHESEYSDYDPRDDWFVDDGCSDSGSSEESEWGNDSTFGDSHAGQADDDRPSHANSQDEDALGADFDAGGSSNRHDELQDSCYLKHDSVIGHVHFGKFQIDAYGELLDGDCQVENPFDGSLDDEGNEYERSPFDDEDWEGHEAGEDEDNGGRIPSISDLGEEKYLAKRNPEDEQYIAAHRENLCHESSCICKLHPAPPQELRITWVSRPRSRMEGYLACIRVAQFFSEGFTKEESICVADVLVYGIKMANLVVNKYDGSFDDISLLMQLLLRHIAPGKPQLPDEYDRERHSIRVEAMRCLIKAKYGKEPLPHIRQKEGSVRLS